MGKKVLDVKNLTIQYRTDLETVHAVNGISFSLEKGETLGLVGETGAGKTTTALGIMGLLPERTAVIPEGSIEFEGTDLLKLSEQEMQKVRGSQISMIFQDPMTALNPVLPVGKQIGEALFLHNEENLSKDEIEKKVEETLELVGIPKARKVEYPYQFSGGMRQRVVIAIALVCNPALLIADEPTTALDVTIQAQILTMICNLQRKYGTSALWRRLAIKWRSCMPVRPWSTEHWRTFSPGKIITPTRSAFSARFRVLPRRASGCTPSRA